MLDFIETTIKTLLGATIVLYYNNIYAKVKR